MSNTVKADNGIEIYENDIYMALDEFQKQYNIESEKITDSQWTAAMIFINKMLFSDKSILKMPNYCKGNLMHGGISNNGAYNIDKMNDIYNIYSYLCYLNNKIVKITDFVYLVGINKQTIYDWREETKPRPGLSTAGSDLFKKIDQDNENSAVNRLLNPGEHPLKATTYLNNVRGWSDKRTIVHEESRAVAPISREEIGAQFQGLLSDNSAMKNT